jgi:NAD+ kinase
MRKNYSKTGGSHPNRKKAPKAKTIIMKKHIGLVVKDETHALRQADRFEGWLIEKGLIVTRRQSSGPAEKQSQPSVETFPERLFCVFVLGGDGTFLSAVRWIGDRQVPIIGVKFGEVGFLAETTEDRLLEVADAILGGQYTTRSQMRLDVQVYRDRMKITHESAFNDVVINKGALARLARIRTHIDGQFLTDYRADGLIVATPTGSTAYSLAAGGPIIHPSVPGIIITPICPFTLTNRPLMVPDAVTIKIQLAESTPDVMLTCDGQVGLKIDQRDTIVISKSSTPVQMITLPDQNYFDVLKAKLRWSGSRV